MRKTIITLCAFVMLFGFAVSGAMAQTAPWWTWEIYNFTPTTIYDELMYDPEDDSLYGSTDNGATWDVNPIVLALYSGSSTQFPEPQNLDATLVDTVTWINGVEYVIDTNTVGYTLPSGSPASFQQVDQPVIPNADGSFIAITVSPDGKLYVLFESGTGEQYILVGTPPEVTVRFTPRSLNLGSQGNWVTCKISGLPEGYKAKDINLGSINIVGINNDFTITPIPRDSEGPAGLGKKLMVKFDRGTLIEALGDTNGNNVELTVVGAWGDELLPFFGTDTFKTKVPKKKKNPK